MLTRVLNCPTIRNFRRTKKGIHWQQQSAGQEKSSAYVSSLEELQVTRPSCNSFVSEKCNGLTKACTAARQAWMKQEIYGDIHRLSDADFAQSIESGQWLIMLYVSN